MHLFDFAASSWGKSPEVARFTTFYLFATALMAGIAVVLPFISVRIIGRRFFVLLSFVAIALFAVAVAAAGIEMGYFHVACAGLLTAYNIALPPQAGIDQSLRRTAADGDSGHIVGRVSWLILVAAAICGMTGVVLDAVHHPASLQITAGQDLWLSLSFVTASLLLGSALTGMVLGHWYLVVRNASFEPLAIVTRILLAAIGLRTLVSLGAATAQADRWSQLISNAGLTGFFLGTGIFIFARWGFGLLAPGIMGWMAWKCVKIKSNQSATGILYVVLAFVLIGEILAKYFLLSEGLAL